MRADVQSRRLDHYLRVLQATRSLVLAHLPVRVRNTHSSFARSHSQRWLWSYSAIARDSGPRHSVFYAISTHCIYAKGQNFIACTLFIHSLELTANRPLSTAPSARRGLCQAVRRLLARLKLNYSLADILRHLAFRRKCLSGWTRRRSPWTGRCGL